MSRGEFQLRMGLTRVFDYYTKLNFSSAHNIHKIKVLRMVSARSALSSFFCYMVLAFKYFYRDDQERPGLDRRAHDQAFQLPLAKQA